MGDYGGNREDVDLEAYPTAKKLVEKCIEFFDEVQNLTPGAALEARLNQDYDLSSLFHKTVTSLIRQAINNNEGWCATIPVAGNPRYRRSKIALPSAATRFFSITAVYMDSGTAAVLRGQYHQHPYGEINCVITMEEESEAELKGMNGWQGAGWAIKLGLGTQRLTLQRMYRTSPAAGTHHYPEVRGGALVALFFLPAGRISYDARPDMPQPASL